MSLSPIAWEDHWIAPRRWQAEALDVLLRASKAPEPEPVVCMAVMGSGKSIVIAELIRMLISDFGTIVITTPTIRLVDQLHDTISRRLGAESVGRFYTHAKESDRPVVVACTDSAVALSKELGARKVLAWIADEAHRTETEEMHEARKQLAPALSFGFSATPFLSDSKRSLSLFKRCVYSYGVKEALADRVIVPWKIEPWTGGEASTDDACTQLIRRSEGPGIVNARKISDAEFYAEKLTEEGIPAEPIHSKLSRDEREARIERLRSGVLRCLVHVSLLSEGVDFPWLRWMCLRRPMSSRVRFAQEVGRVVRASDGKKIAIIFDPHDLFGEFKLGYDAVLGGEALLRTPASEIHPADRAAQLLMELPESALESVDATAMGRVGRYLRQLSAVIEALGWGDRSSVGKWRSEAPSRKQIDCVERVSKALRKVRAIPPKHLDALRFCYASRVRLNRGQASDFITILFGLAKKPRYWPDLAELMVDAEGTRGETDRLPTTAGRSDRVLDLFAHCGAS